MAIPSITNTQTAGVQNSISQIMESSSNIANKLSSGQKIISPYEDPAGLAIGTKLEVNLAVFKEALSSANQASAVLNIAYGGAKSITNMLKRLSQLSIMALNGSAGETDRKLIDRETKQLVEEIDRIATSTNFNGRKLLDGSSADIGSTATVGTTTRFQPDVIAEEGFAFKFSDKGIMNSDASSFDDAKMKVEYDATLNDSKGGFKLTVDGTDYKIAEAKVWGSSTIQDSSGKNLFAYDGGTVSGNSITGITKIRGYEDKNNTFFTLDDKTGKVSDKNGEELWNYKQPPIGPFEFDFNSEKNAIMDSAGIEIIKFNPNSRKYTLNVDANNKIKSQDGGTDVYEYVLNDEADVKKGGYLKSIDTTTPANEISYFRIDNASDIKSITNFFVKGNDGKVTSHEFSLGSNGMVRDTETSETIFKFTPAGEKQAEPLVFQVGTEKTDKIRIGFDSITSQALGIDKIKLMNYQDAEETRTTIDKALSIMFDYNAKIGAYQSRFRSVAESVSTSIENVDAARSQFLDADFTELTKQFSQEQAKLTAAITAEAKLIKTPQSLLALLQYM